MGASPIPTEEYEHWEKSDMATIGIDCELILDGTGYFIKPGTYRVQQPRIRKTTVRADGGLAYVDLGPGKRVWSMVLLCLNDLARYDGTPTGEQASSTATPCAPPTPLPRVPRCCIATPSM